MGKDVKQIKNTFIIPFFLFDENIFVLLNNLPGKLHTLFFNKQEYLFC